MDQLLRKMLCIQRFLPRKSNRKNPGQTQNIRDRNEFLILNIRQMDWTYGLDTWIGHMDWTYGCGILHRVEIKLEWVSVYKDLYIQRISVTIFMIFG